MPHNTLVNRSCFSANCILILLFPDLYFRPTGISSPPVVTIETLTGGIQNIISVAKHFRVPAVAHLRTDKVLCFDKRLRYLWVLLHTGIGAGVGS